MKSTNWKDIAELIGIAAIIGSLVFVGLQLQQAQDVALSDLGAAIHSARVEENSTISDHADVWIKGNAGENLSAQEEANYLAMLNSYHYRHVVGYGHRVRFGQTQVASSIVADFAIFLFENPGARATWSKVNLGDDPRKRALGVESGPSGFERAVNDALATLEALSEDQ